MELHYTLHPNWTWVLMDAINGHVGRDEAFTNLIKHDTMKKLPSQCEYTKRFDKIKSKRRKATYALFRIELVKLKRVTPSHKVMELVHSCWVSGQLFGFLDAKDALCKHLIDAYSSSTGYLPSLNLNCSSLSTSELDPINKMKYILQQPKAEGVFPMPVTFLLPWDITSIEAMNCFEIPSTPCLLKAALGKWIIDRLLLVYSY